MARVGHVSLWHPWRSTPGNAHTLTYWQASAVHGLAQPMPCNSVEEIIDAIAGNRLYTFCDDIFSKREFPDSDELLRHQKTTAYISRTGRISALRLRHKRQSGFLIPRSGWGCEGMPYGVLLEKILSLFQIFNYEALTPASLSEKVLRATLPKKVLISRPSAMLRQRLLEEYHGALIIGKKEAEYFERVFEYDLNKAYLSFATLVPSPYNAPVASCFSRNDDSWQQYPTMFAHVQMVARKVHNAIGPIMYYEKNDDGETVAGTCRPYEDGELVDRWLWKEELEACLEAGFELLDIPYAHCWQEMSDWMTPWANIMWETYEEWADKDEDIKRILKTMMVGLPGRFLKQPETHTLVHISEGIRESDIPITALTLSPGDIMIRDWFIRSEYDLQSAQLTPIGSYIVMKCRQEMYRLVMQEIQSGNQLLQVYTDCVRFVQPVQQIVIGTTPGTYKVKVFKEAIVEENSVDMFTLEDERVLLAPGLPHKDKDGHVSQRRLDRLRRNNEIRAKKKGVNYGERSTDRVPP